MERLAALVPRPRLHLIRFHGVLAPNAKLRSKIVPAPAERCHRDLKRGLSRAGRAGAHELGQAAQTGLRYRHRTLPELRRQLEDHRRHRRSAGDCQNPQPSGPTDPRPAAIPFFDQSKAVDFLDRLPALDSSDGVLMALASACVLQERFHLGV